MAFTMPFEYKFGILDVVVTALVIYQLITLPPLLRKKLRERATRDASTPPGPPGRFLIGNAYQIPADRQWLKFDKWISQYGEYLR